MAGFKSENKTPNTLISKMTQVAPYYICKYVEWYLADPTERQSWDELCRCDQNFKSKDGSVKTETFCKDNWLTRDDAQQAIQVYMKHMKTLNIMRIYEKMLDKAMNGDVQAARYIQDFHNSAFFDESEDEINEFLSVVNIPKLKKKG